MRQWVRPTTSCHNQVFKRHAEPTGLHVLKVLRHTGVQTHNASGKERWGTPRLKEGFFLIANCITFSGIGTMNINELCKHNTKLI